LKLADVDPRGFLRQTAFLRLIGLRRLTGVLRLTAFLCSIWFMRLTGHLRLTPLAVRRAITEMS
jgi:hypothetical protein